MNNRQRENLEKMSGRVTDVSEFLDLSAAEVWLIDFKIDLGEAIGARRTELNLTREQLAKTMSLALKKVVALEEGGPRVSLDEQMLTLRAMDTPSATLSNLLGQEFDKVEAASDKVAVA